MQTTSFSKDYKFSDSSMKAWTKCLEHELGDTCVKVLFIEDYDIQKSYWDCVALFSGVKRPLRVEVKTRRINFMKMYDMDKLRAIEINGNNQKGDLGSSIYNGHADLFATGFFDGEYIQRPIIFWKSQVAEIVQEAVNNGKVRVIENKYTDGKYNSKFALVPEEWIEPFKWN